MQQYMRSTAVTIGDRTFHSSDLHIEFDVPFDDNTTPNESNIRIYNLNDDSINRIEHNQQLTLNTGYEGDVGMLLQGRVSYVTTRKQGPDKVTTVYVIDGTDLTSVKIDRKAYTNGTRGSQILKDLVPLLKLPVAAFRLPKDKVYEEGYSISGQIVDNLSQIARDCGASFYINRGNLYIRALSDGDDAQFVLKTDTGLLDSPEFFFDDDAKGYNIRCLLQHRITTASIIDIESRYVQGRFRARRGRHICNEAEFITEVEVVENVGG
ncbi:MAG: hypothetical protein K0Q94_548 [Paenibacillus sp.]|nr:hypothetical protein [Paenibacillus sp.]